MADNKQFLDKQGVATLWNLIKQNFVAIEDMPNLVQFRGVVSELAEVADPKAGDVVIVGTKEFVHDGEEWHEFGDETLGEAVRFKGVESELPESLESYRAGDLIIVDGEEFICVEKEIPSEEEGGEPTKEKVWEPVGSVSESCECAPLTEDDILTACGFPAVEEENPEEDTEKQP